jgi:hypothetical protein
MTLVTDIDVRLYRQEKARKERRDAKLVEQAKVHYDAVCKAHRLRPLTTNKKGEEKHRHVCACGAPCWGKQCWPCRKTLKKAA